MNITASEGILLYVVLVGLAGTVVTARVLMRLQTIRFARSERVKARRLFSALRTRGPRGDPEEDRARALQSIDKQFSVTSRVAVPTLIFITTILMSLPFLGAMPTVVVSALATAVTVMGGVAARPYLENAIAGLVISESRLMSVGDTVMLDEVYGTIEDITATHTTIRVWDWRRWVVPNAQMLQTSFFNYSLHDKAIWTSVDFWVAYDADVARARALVLEAAEASAHFSKVEPPQCWVMKTEKDAVGLRVAAWADTPSAAWELSHDIRSAIAERFHAEGLQSCGVRITGGPAAQAQAPHPPRPMR